MGDDRAQFVHRPLRQLNARNRAAPATARQRDKELAIIRAFKKLFTLLVFAVGGQVACRTAVAQLFDREQALVPFGMFLKTQQIGRGGGKVGQPDRGGLLEAKFAAGHVVVQDQRHRVQRVGGLGLE